MEEQRPEKCTCEKQSNKKSKLSTLMIAFGRNLRKSRKRCGTNKKIDDTSKEVCCSTNTLNSLTSSVKDSLLKKWPLKFSCTTRNGHSEIETQNKKLSVSTPSIESHPDRTTDETARCDIYKTQLQDEHFVVEAAASTSSKTETIDCENNNSIVLNGGQSMDDEEVVVPVAEDGAEDLPVDLVEERLALMTSDGVEIEENEDAIFRIHDINREGIRDDDDVGDKTNNNNNGAEEGGGGGGNFGLVGGLGNDATRGIYGISNTGSVVMVNGECKIQWLPPAAHEDCDEAARLTRALEIERGIDAPENFKGVRRIHLLCPPENAAENNKENTATKNNTLSVETVDSVVNRSEEAATNDTGNNNNNNTAPCRIQLYCPPNVTVDSLRNLFQNNVQLKLCPVDNIGCHTQVDFIHCLVPDLREITQCSFYWGKMDRYEAERLLEGKREGTFLLRDSAQEEFLFSVSFRKYNRSLHARIEQWNHTFSFDSHDPGVFTSETVCGLMEHYKDPSSCMFFEPVLTWPLHRNTAFSLQHLCRAAIVAHLTYDNINLLQLPKSLKSYLKEYHYRQKVRVERFDEEDVQWLDLRNSN